MIYTVTLNPAIDYVMCVDAVQVGTIMRSACENVLFGGKGINVSLVLKELGVPSVATGFAGGFTGQAIAKGIACDAIQSNFVEVQGISRINVKIRATEETDINGNGPEITAQETERLFAKLNGLQKEDILVLAGSVPKSVPADIYQIIMQKLFDKGVLFVVDAEKNLLLNTLQYKPFFIKPNHEELGALFGVDIQTQQQAAECAQKLQEMGAQNVLVSMGGMGAVLADAMGNIHFINAPQGKVINTVGAGDSMLAGFLAGYLKKQDYEYALRLGTAAGSATAFSQGLATRDEILKLL